MTSTLSSRPRALRRALSAAACAAAALSCAGALAPAAHALSGPVTTPPGGVAYSQGTSDPGRAGGRTDSYSNFNGAAYKDLYWGPINSGAGQLSFDGRVDSPGETLTFQPGQSDLAHGVLRFTGVAQGPPSAVVRLTYNTRLTITVTDANGVPLALTSPGSLGLEAGIGGVLHVTGNFKVNLLFEAAQQGSSSYQPAHTLYDSIPKLSTTNYYLQSFTPGFFYSSRPPVAAFSLAPTTALAGQTVAFDGRASTAPNGTITSYVWNFGDGTTNSGATVGHAYSAAGNYTATLTVTDSNGQSASVAHTVTITLPALSAAFTATPGTVNPGQAVAFDASGSQSQTGTIRTYAWDFGDGTTGSGVKTSHAYEKPGSYTVKLFVTDAAGQTVGATHTITVVVPPLTASFTTSTANAAPGQSIAFDGSGSHSQGGTIQSYSWDFGDGTTATGATVNHAYGAPGTYTAKLFVVDNTGQSAGSTKVITIAYPPVTAAFQQSASQVLIHTPVNFDASGSTASGGESITSYSWNFGDGTSASGPTVSHSYSARGTYTVTLTVTGSHGQTSHATRTITITLPPPPVLRVGGGTLRYDRNGFVTISVRCSAPAGQRCNSHFTIVSADRRSRRAVTIASVFFSFDSGQSARLRIPIKRSAFGLLARLRSLTVKLTMDTSNDAGNRGRTTSRTRLAPR